MTPTTPKKNDPYLATRVLTASKEELRLMLLDGAVKYARQGRDGLARQDYQACFAGFDRCRAIIAELITTAKPKPNADLHSKIVALYTFFMTHLMEASHQRSTEKADAVIELLEYERQTWRLLMDKLAAERQAAGARGPAHQADAPAPQAGALSVAG